MKFLYKQTGIRVESDEMLDSTMFRPVEEEPEVKEEPIEEEPVEEEPVEEEPEVKEEPELKEEPEKKPVKKTATTGRKTPAAKK